MSENNIPENEEITPVEASETEVIENAEEENTSDKKAPRKPNYLLIIIACGYLAYLGVTMFIDIFIKKVPDMDPRWVFIASSILFSIVGIGYGGHTVIRLCKDYLANAPRSTYYDDDEGEDNEYEDDEEYIDEDEE